MGNLAIFIDNFNPNMDNGAYEVILAAKEGQVDVVKALVSEDPALADCKDSVGQTPLMWASYKGHRGVASVLIEMKANIDEWNCQSGRTALYMACEFGNWEVADLLLKHGADPTFRRKLYGRDCLMIAAFNGHAKVVKGLLESGFGDVDAVDNHKCTALRLAVRADRTASTVRVLLDHGADPMKADRDGKTAIMFARESQNTECVQVLEDWEKVYQLCKARWISREGKCLDYLMDCHELAMKDAPAYLKRRLWKRNHASRTRERSGAIPTIDLAKLEKFRGDPEAGLHRFAMNYMVHDMPYGCFLQLKEYI